MISIFGYILRRCSSTIVNLISLIINNNFLLSRLLKRQILKSLITSYDLKTFVETGTYLGDTSLYLSRVVKKGSTIEVSKFLYTRAKFRLRKKKNIEVLLGDSVEVLGNILGAINTPCLFYLDGHFSGGISSSAKNYSSPLNLELEIIKSFHFLKGSIIVIDDARELGRTDGYPEINEIERIFENQKFSKIELCDLLIILFN